MVFALKHNIGTFALTAVSSVLFKQLSPVIFDVLHKNAGPDLKKNYESEKVALGFLFFF